MPKVGDQVKWEVTMYGEIIHIDEETGLYTLEYEDGSRHVLPIEKVCPLLVQLEFDHKIMNPEEIEKYAKTKKEQ